MAKVRQIKTLFHMKVGRQAGVTLLELLIALAVVGIVITGLTGLFGRFENSQLSLASKNQAESQSGIFLDRMTKYFRTRVLTREDNGFSIKKCSQPSPSFDCLNIYRRQKAGTDAEVVERIQVKSACLKLSPKAKEVAKSLGLSLVALADSMRPLCEFRCTPGEKPVVVIRHWPNSAETKFQDTIFPKGREITAGDTVSGGFCVSQSDGTVHLQHAFSYLRTERNALLKLVRQDYLLPLTEDTSKIEWLP